ncbi:hypothetical protein Mapa_016169 [Marchantia paleacea]|nr:hypothetical protein Mapa_016169 [Marchantia paleacea]
MDLDFRSLRRNDDDDGAFSTFWLSLAIPTTGATDRPQASFAALSRKPSTITGLLPLASSHSKSPNPSRRYQIDDPDLVRLAS